jgi:hypothetical protein
MADDLKKTGRQDDERINAEQDHELGYWAEKLGVSRGYLGLVGLRQPPRHARLRGRQSREVQA